MTKSTIPTTSAIPNQDRLEILKSAFPEAFTEGKIDLEKLKAALGEDLASGKERYNFSWAGKRDAIGILQIPTRATLVPAPEESINFDTTQNIFIEGDNLEVLKLLYKSYFGRVKLIYIDPPYNTGNDFIYPDNYTDPIETYLQISGQKDAEGNLLTSNPETSGRYHSAWLSMMYPRLFLARQLLRDDGVIFVSIDDHEVQNLRLVMSEIFGEENFITTIIWHKMDSPKNSAIHFSEDHDYIVVYAKNANIWRPNLLTRTEEMVARYKNPDNDPRGPWLLSDLAARNYYAEGRYSITTPKGRIIKGPPAGSYWRVSKERFEELDKDNRIWWGNTGNNRPGMKRFLSEVKDGVVPQTYWPWKDVGSTRHSKQELSKLLSAKSGEDLFITPKPVALIKRILEIATDKESIAVDFFSGTGTIAQAVYELNKADDGQRKFIVVQLPEPTEQKEFPTIADIGKERIRRVIKKLQVPENPKQPSLPMENKDVQMDLGFRVYKLAESNFRPWVGVQEKDPETYTNQMEAFNDALVEGWTVDAVLTELAIKHGLCLTYQVENIAILGGTVYKLTDPEKEQSLFVCLDSHIDLAAFNELKLDKETIFICLDSALDDETAANLALVCRLETI
ncbi:MAG: site-specific DNA-methyltransferase [Chloroflexi bacterium]|nr:site-specific DNA-methyltransferase [Chloroflexota bacterium]